jgi:hypothetical protein
MDSTVYTGVTKTGDRTSVEAKSFVSKGGETVFLLLQVQAGEREALTLLEECETVVRHALLETEGEGWTRLDGALKEMNGLMKGLFLARTLEEVHAIVGLVDASGTLHVSSAGRGEAYLVRGGAASQITEYTRGKPLSAFVHISSGPLEGHDAVVFSTQRLLRVFTPAQLAQTVVHGERAIQEITDKLTDEREEAAVALLQQPGAVAASEEEEEETPARTAAFPSRRYGARRSKSFSLSIPPSVTRAFTSTGKLVLPFLSRMGRKSLHKLSSSSSMMQNLQERVVQFKRKRRAHLLLVAGAVAAFLLIFVIVRLSTASERSKTRTELSALMQKISEEIKTADNRRIAGDTDSANQILDRADAWAKQVMDNESGLFRVEALDLLDRIRAKKEEINNILRVSPRVLVNVSAKDESVALQGLIGVADGEFIAYDRQHWFHIILNGVDDGKAVADDGFIIAGTEFARMKSPVFLTTGSSVVEIQGSQPVSMKTEDPAGWATGKDLEAYQRYLYILSSTDNQIYKYERLPNRYGPAAPYNINGDLSGALDMTIDASIYVLKEGGTVVRLMRGEAKPFIIRHMPDGALATTTKMTKIADRNFYFLDPVKSRVIVVGDGGATGEAGYVKQYVLEGEQLGKLQDLYVDTEESHLYVADEKRVYVIDLVK